jgi:hypothetical protein
LTVGLTEQTGQFSQDKGERAGRPRTVETSKLGTRVVEQNCWDRTAGAGEPGKGSQIGRPEHDGKDRTARTG